MSYNFTRCLTIVLYLVKPCFCFSIKCMRGSGSSNGRGYGPEYEYGGSGGSYSGTSAHSRYCIETMLSVSVIQHQTKMPE